VLNRHLGSAAVTGGGHIQQGLVVPEAEVIPPLVRRQAGNIQPTMRQRHSSVCPVSPQMVCPGCVAQGRSAHFGVDLVEANTHKNRKKEKLVLRERRAFYSGGRHNYVNVQLQSMLSYLAQIASRFVG
jgi:hypothetical protein